MTTKKLNFMPYAQAHIEMDENGTHLFSYYTKVITINPDDWFIITGTYSATTARHIGAFLRELLPQMSYQQAKELYKKGYKLNVYTGEIKGVNENV